MLKNYNFLHIPMILKLMFMNGNISERIDTERYARNLMLEGFDASSQLRLQESRVGIVGAGALGSVVAMYLAGAGVGHLKIADYDTVSISNLQRQVFFCEREIGEPKCDMLSESVRRLNSNCAVECFREAVTADNIEDFVAGCNVLAVCTDTYASKVMVVDEVRRLRNQLPIDNRCLLAVVVGGVREYEGQVTVFTEESSSGYGDLFPNNHSGPMAPPGVFSPVPGIVGSIQACEILKLITGIGESLIDALLHFDARDMNMKILHF